MSGHGHGHGDDHDHPSLPCAASSFALEHGLRLGARYQLRAQSALFVVLRNLTIVEGIVLTYCPELDVIGESEATARYAGIAVARVTMVAVMISGGLCGVAGMMQASAIERSLSETLSGGLGFTAVITTWLARLSPPVIVLVSFLFSILTQGGAFLQSSLRIPSSVSSIMQGIILFFVLGGEFFVRYRFVLSGGPRVRRDGVDGDSAGASVSGEATV